MHIAILALSQWRTIPTAFIVMYAESLETLHGNILIGPWTEAMQFEKEIELPIN